MPRCGTFLLYRSKVEVFLFCSKGAVPLGQNAAVEVGRHRSKEKNMKNKNKIRLAGALAGIVNGVFGGGGGMIAVPLLAAGGLEEKRAHATAILIIAPVSLAGAIAYIIAGYAAAHIFLPAAVGMAAGGALGAVFLNKLPLTAVRAVFVAVMFAAGIRMVFA